eukprot:1161045-Pelagomonas_calceolata.AAC.25
MSRGAGYDRHITSERLCFYPGLVFVQMTCFCTALTRVTLSAWMQSSALRAGSSKLDKLIDPSSVTRVFKITKYIGMLVTGLMRCAPNTQLTRMYCYLPLAADARSIVQQVRQQAAEFRFKYGYEIPVDFLARVMADKAQVYTQHVAMCLSFHPHAYFLRGVCY